MENTEQKLNNNSRFYNLIYIIRQDISTVDLEKINNDISSLLVSYGGSVVKQEYWGLRALAYEIKGNTRGHYMLLGADIPNNECINELNRKIKLSNEVIRFYIERVKSISKAPSGILKSFAITENANTVDVTIQNKTSGNNSVSSGPAIPGVVSEAVAALV